MLSKDYSTVVPQGSPEYLAPLDPTCGDSERYMPVHLVSGGGWGIVDRRTGRLRRGQASAHERHASWNEVKAAVHDLNASAH
jgi:hypothetical protein